ncbi:hypothetical protein RQP46_008628 [Phenoliferia psychrophenolica]
MATTKVLILGATGETGKHVLLSALANPAYSTVLALGRKAPSVDPSTPGFSKLVSEPTISFDGLVSGDQVEVQKLKDAQADTVLVTLGTTRAAAGSFEKFVKIDREYVLAAAKGARVEGKDQKIVYCSSGGASSTSFAPYLKSKGLTEEGLASLGYKETIIFRPGMLVVPGGRAEHRLVESLAAKVTGVLSYVLPGIEIKTPVLGAAIASAGILGFAELEKKGLGKKETLKGHEAWVVGNGDAVKLGSEATA